MEPAQRQLARALPPLTGNGATTNPSIHADRLALSFMSSWHEFARDAVQVDAFRNARITHDVPIHDEGELYTVGNELVHPDDTRLQAVVSHRGQELINVAIMGSVNSVAYVQRQIDNILREFQAWYRAYIDDITVVSDTFEEHVERLELVFTQLRQFNITLSPEKCRLCFPSLMILGKEIDSLSMTTNREKLKVIIALDFPKTYK